MISARAAYRGDMDEMREMLEPEVESFDEFPAFTANPNRTQV